ncbi:hypothetical protein [Candidatus Lokiarchaeum ossiferum]|uniref:hypothetical protein n=1 Tax=Candidatus Lokiarchaeum ossiferum TaxID=2951803 RepID=UPI00352E4D8E
MESNKKLAPYFSYIQKCCPQRSEKQIYYDQLKSKLRKRFHITDDQVKELLKEFVNQNLLVVAFDDSVSINLLANEKRKHIMTFIEAYPGVYINVIKTRLHLGTNQVLWHLGFLVEFKYIQEHPFGKLKAYGLPEIPKVQIKIGFICLKTSFRHVLITLLTYPAGLSNMEIATSLNMAKNKAAYSIKELLKLGFLSILPPPGKKYVIHPHFKNFIHETIQTYQSVFVS